jgi:RecB family endonuclease NucS
LKRQYFVRGEVCDILAVDDNRQLVVLELKNLEDRYIVQQLTRYYDALLEIKPFQAEVDYGEPIRLVAVAPSFHRHNEIDRKYHKLIFDFLKIIILKESDRFYLHLQNIDTEQVFKREILYREIDFSIFNEDLPGNALDKGIWVLNSKPELFSIDEQANHSIMHQIQLGKTDCLASQALNSSSQIQMFPFNLLGIGFTHNMLVLL